MKSNVKSCNMNIRLDERTYDEIKELAWQQRLSLSELVRQLIDNYIEAKRIDIIDK